MTNLPASDGSGLEPPDVAIFIPSFGEGGVDRMLVNIAGGFACRGLRVDFITTHDAPYLEELASEVRSLRFRDEGDASLVRQLTEYVTDRAPAAVISGKGRDDRLAVAARARAQPIRTRFFIRVGTAVSGRSEAKLILPWRRARARRELRDLLAGSDGVLANATAVADEVSRAAGYPRERIAVVPNPTVTERLHRLAAEPPPHPWLRDGGSPVILGIGGLRRQKDFGTLLRAFALLRRDRPARLLILGSGRQHARLARLAARLKVSDAVDLPGFSRNPYSCLAHASLFVLSSLWEGLPNVLIEALAVGTPVVATDTPGGAREILQDGRYGPLVPARAPRLLAESMCGVLDNPLPSECLRAAAARYTLDAATSAYLEALDLQPEQQEGTSPGGSPGDSGAGKV